MITAKISSTHKTAGKLWLALFLCITAVLGSALPARAFSLAGPFAPWMTTNLSYRLSGELGGPMALHEEYRWNMPIMTYGFDKSFVEYFGAEGVQAVEDAIATLNRLPPASRISLDQFMTEGLIRWSSSAAQSNLLDLKSVTLCLLLQRMGLASPTPNVYVLREWDAAFFREHPFWWSSSSMPLAVFSRFISMRNYDPITRLESACVNTGLFTCELNLWEAFQQADAVERSVDLTSYPSYAIADRDWIRPGTLCLGLTRDDAGGLAYLLSRTNLNVEVMDESVTPLFAQAWSRSALRPGIEKITFRRHRTDAAGRFLPIQWPFCDTYIANGITRAATVLRVVKQPDILFSARDLGCHISRYPETFYVEAPVWEQNRVQWANCSALNGKPGGAGPGVIKPQARITFQTLGKYVAAAGGMGQNQSATFCNWAQIKVGSPGVTVLTGSQTNLTSLVLDRQTVTNSDITLYQWTVLGWEGRSYRIDVSRDNIHWTAAGVVQNTNGVFTFSNPTANGPYLRAVLQE